MNKLLFTLCVGCFSIAYSQNLNFTDSKFKALLLSSNPGNQIAQNLSGNYIAIDANNDGEIQDSEAQQIKVLNIKLNGTPAFNNLPDQITDALLFTNMEELYINDTKSAVISFSNNSKIKKVLYTGTGGFTDNTGTAQNVLVDFSFNSCSSVQDINQFLSNLNPYIGTTSILRFNNCPQLIGNIVLNEKTIKQLYLENCNNITSITATSCYQLEKLHFQNLNSLTNILVNGNSGPSLSQVYNQNIDLTATNCTNLEDIAADTDHYYSVGAYFSSANLNGSANLKKIKGLNATSINFATVGLMNLEELDCSFYNRYGYHTTSGVYFGNVASLNLTGLPKLKILKAFNQPITNAVNFSTATMLQNIDITNSCGYMNTVNVNNLANLQALKTDRSNTVGTQGNDDLQKITARNCTALTNFIFRNNQNLKELDIQNCSGIQKLSIGYYASMSDGVFPELNTVNLLQCTGMKEITIQSTKINNLNTSDCVALTSLDLSDNNFLPSINILNNIKLEYLGLQNMPLISQVNTTANNKLENGYFINCPQITQLNFSSSPSFKYLTLWNMANLTYVNVRNGSIEDGFDFINYNPNLAMCVDNAQLNDLQALYADITFTTNCGGFLSTKDSENSKNEIKIVPNPVKDFVMIKAEEPIKNVKIFNVLGRVIYNQDCDNELMKIDLSAHPSGNYIVTVKTNKTEISKKIIKQ
ncbi:T9SS type A sorting domain-containing protein [uncultured Chryseobacterium sp.]|uniref:T9SS type A sorting domain-containing protein n=1 Tax=uncultured Chryseobacterium sp. TaxID=259322 RepID=UPI00258957DD|nr:T9SS type A sorting domain-containing protein [uncultured Chryseobacterium sp.]